MLKSSGDNAVIKDSYKSFHIKYGKLETYGKTETT